MTYSFKRPTSPVECEPLSLTPEETLYPGSDEEAPIEERRARRRRIELQARHHLQGGDLFILSAGLRGPFVQGWVNPWIRKRKREHLGATRRIKQDDGGRAKSGRQDDESTTIPETINPSRRWLKSDDVALRQVFWKRSRSPTPTPAMKPRDGTRPVLTKLVDPSSSDEHREARRPSPPNAPRFFESPLKADISSITTKRPGDLVVGQDIVAEVPAASSVEDLQSSLRVVPPSTNLPAFEYRSLIHAEKNEVEKAQVIVVAKAQERMFRELSFTSTANMEQLKSRAQSQSRNIDSPAQRLHEFSQRRRQMNQANLPEGADKSLASSKTQPFLSKGKPSIESEDASAVKQLQGSSLNERQITQANFPCGRNAKSTASSTFPPILSNGNPSIEVDELPAAQILPVYPVVNGSGPSTLSMNLLVTDEGTVELPSTQNSSTQAAIQKAMRSFQEDIITTLKHPPSHVRNPWANRATSPTPANAFKEKTTPDTGFLGRPYPHTNRPLGSGYPNEEPISTQAMIDAASPFTLPGQSSPPHPSPTKLQSSSNLHSLNTLSMSSAGTASNEHLHDGQQQPQAADTNNNFDDSVFDLEGAIQEAQQFLHASQLENETRT